MTQRSPLPLLILVAQGCGTWTAGGLNLNPIKDSHINIRYEGGMTPPPGVDEAGVAINEVLSKHYPNWWDIIDLVIELHPYGSTITGPYIKTGFDSREAPVAVLLPPPPYPEGIEDKIARVVGTIRVEHKWPAPLPSKKRYVVILMDMRVGVTKREVLLGEGGDKPRRDIGGTALFYEVAQRVVPMGLADEYPEATPGENQFRVLEREMKELYRSAVIKVPKVGRTETSTASDLILPDWTEAPQM